MKIILYEYVCVCGQTSAIHKRGLIIDPEKRFYLALKRLTIEQYTAHLIAYKHIPLYRNTLSCFYWRILNDGKTNTKKLKAMDVAVGFKS